MYSDGNLQYCQRSTNCSGPVDFGQETACCFYFFAHFLTTFLWKIEKGRAVFPFGIRSAFFRTVRRWGYGIFVAKSSEIQPAPLLSFPQPLVEPVPLLSATMV